MDAIIILLALVLSGTISIVSFVIGAKVGQSASRGEPIKLPELSPVKAFEERREKDAVKKESKRLEALMHNIDTYDGTGAGQRDIPGGN